MSTPNKEKKSEEGENGKVHPFPIPFILSLVKIWYLRDARLAQIDGRWTYHKSRHGRRSGSLRCIRWPWRYVILMLIAILYRE